MPYVHACGQSFTKKRPDFWKCFHCDISTPSVYLYLQALHVIYVYNIEYNEIRA